ncbi:MAG: ABC transporter ATP-binding protein [Gammaproteobacteria bacterium]|nr:ABC transporter ATP-binding protein [Gammaproteobacteria bacterium]
MDRSSISTDTLLRIRDLRTHFFTPEGRVRAVDGVDLDIRRGRTLGVLGESGSGKSVTALSVMRLVQAPGRIVDGRIVLDGQDLLQLPEDRMRAIRGRDVSMIFQEPMTSLNPVYTLGDQIAEVFMVHRGASRRDAMQGAVEMLAQVGIPSPESRVNDYPHQFSGGMRQRAMIAMAIACQGKLLIADEPTTALDVTIQAQILDLMLGLQDEMGMSIMLITHDLGVIAETSDDVAVMYAGQVMEYLSIDALFTTARHPYTQGLLASIPRLGAKFEHGKQPLKEIPGVVPNLIRLPPGCPFADRCARVMDRCRTAKPPLFRLSEDHGSRCWLAERDALELDSHSAGASA